MKQNWVFVRQNVSFWFFDQSSSAAFLLSLSIQFLIICLIINLRADNSMLNKASLLIFQINLFLSIKLSEKLILIFLRIDFVLISRAWIRTSFFYNLWLLNSFNLKMSFEFLLKISFQKLAILFSLWTICIELRFAVGVLALALMICSCIWVISCSCCHCLLNSWRLTEHCDLNICFIMICIWVICCLIQFISVNCWLVISLNCWLIISMFDSVVDERENLNVFSKHFNKDSSLNDTFLYAMKSDLCFFNEDSTSESEAVDLDFLTHFVVFDDVINNFLKFLSVKFFWDLVVRWLIWAHNNRILEKKSMKMKENFEQIALTSQISLQRCFLDCYT